MPKQQPDASKDAQKDQKDGKAKKPAAKPLFLHLSTKDKVIFARHLAVMMNAGIPLQESLTVIEEQVAQPSLQYVLRSAIADLGDGMQLHTGLEKFPRLFDSFFVNAISVGESSGSLSSTLIYLAAQLEKSEELSGKVKSALLYPAIVLLGALGIGAYLAFVLLPKILPLFVSLKVTLPPTTRALLAVSGWLTAYWHIALIALAAFLVFFSLLMRIHRIRYAVYFSLHYLPVFGGLTRDVQTAKFARILGTLLSSGVTIVTALNVTAVSISDPVYRAKLERIAKAVDRGGNIGAELRNSQRLFSRTTSSMVGIGERTGRLSESLIALAEFAEHEVDATTRNLSTLIEPITLMIVGLLVGFVALSIITPIYQITQGIHA